MFEKWTSLETPILAITVISFFVLYMFKKYNYWKNRNVFYFKPNYIFGNFYEVITFRENVGVHLAKLCNSTTKPFFGIYIFTTPHLVVNDPELIKQILVKDFNYFNDRPIYCGNHDKIGKYLLFVNKNPEWKTLRTKTSPVFTSGKLKGMVPLICDIGKKLQTYVRENCLDKESVNVREVCAKFSTDVISRCAFGINARSLEEENAGFRSAGKLIFDSSTTTAIQQLSSFFVPQLVELFRMKIFDKRVENFMRDAFWGIIKERESSKMKSNDLIDIIIELRNNEKLTGKIQFEGDKVVAQAAQFFAAGFETTSSTMAYALYELCLNPEIQRKLREEIKEVLDQHGEFTYDNVQGMKYLHMVVSETMRMYPVLPYLDRTCNTDYTIPGTDVIIEKGTPVHISLLGLHINPKYFPDPLRFDPERFSEERINDIVPFSYLPFGEGPRICIGERFGMMGTKLGLVYFLSEFEVVKSEKTASPLKYEPKAFLLAPKGGLPMKVNRI